MMDMEQQRYCLFMMLQRLKSPFDGEDTNNFLKYMRLRFLRIFYEVNNTCTECGSDINELSALNFFTMHELNIIKIVFKGEAFAKFLRYFTIKNFLGDEIVDHGKRKHTEIEYFLDKLRLRSKFVIVTSKFINNSLSKAISFITMKLQRLRYARKKQFVDINYQARKIIKELNLSGYNRWCIRVGSRFTNQERFDERNVNCLFMLQEDEIKKEQKKGDRAA